MENERVQQREDLVGRRQHEREQNQRTVFTEIRKEEIHNRILLGCSYTRKCSIWICGEKAGRFPALE